MADYCLGCGTEFPNGGSCPCDCPAGVAREVVGPIHKCRPNTTGVLCGASVSSNLATTSSYRNDTTCPACLRLWWGSSLP